MHMHLVLLLSFFFFFLNKKEEGEIKKIQKQCVFVDTRPCVSLIAFETKFPNFISCVA